MQEHQDVYIKNIPSTPSALGILDAQGRSEFWASLALLHTRGLGARSCKKLLEFFGSAYEAVKQIRDWPKAGVYEDRVTAFNSGSWRTTAKVEWDANRNLHGTILLWTDARYPRLLREVIDAPVRLYCLGDLSLLSNPCVGIVGTRECTLAGVEAAKNLAANLAASGITIVSGMATGIDRHAHCAAIEFPGSTIGILGAGLDVNYPLANNDLRQRVIQNGLLVSEYAPGTRPDPRNFPVRNRIISGLSLGTLVVEAALRSGSLITARLALEQNRSVYAIPGSLGIKEAQGCQELIRQGAQPIFSFQDIIKDLSVQLTETLAHKPIPLQTDPPNQFQTKSSIQFQTDPPIQFQFEAPTQSSPILLPAKLKKNPSKQATPPKSLPAFEPNSLEYQILTHLATNTSDIDSLCEHLDAEPGAVSAILTILEIQGLIKQDVHLHYSLA